MLERRAGEDAFRKLVAHLVFAACSQSPQGGCLATIVNQCSLRHIGTRCVGQEAGVHQLRRDGCCSGCTCQTP
jgi:hypothetical protein